MTREEFLMLPDLTRLVVILQGSEWFTNRISDAMYIPEDNHIWVTKIGERLEDDFGGYWLFFEKYEPGYEFEVERLELA